ncbi:phosphotyrosine protein phosphatase [Rhizoctonia solani]|uniref:Phosphotyrosine protein phosphatase n=1 Tax=Rhizoctonia solani TaxID=456999 RepID=A0A8H8P8K9_9AGAM|nr:phosphotyrosine protein phosphatase [Rhizoctonia solani]QRW27265.1 phosphotyrosine protein phosphatase [Rhizoctonia solani]
MGHAVLEHEAKKRELPVVVDSAGTAAYHVGELPDERTVSTCKKAYTSIYSVPINHHARAVKSSDFKTFDYILASDNANLSNLKSMAPKDSTATIALFGAYGDNQPIADPYYGGISGFEKAFDQCVRYSNGFLDQVFGKKESVL